MKKIYGISVNSQQDLFAVATEDGVRVFACNQLHQILHLDRSVVGSLRLAKVLNATTLLGLVSGGMMPKYSENVVMMWNEHSSFAGFQMEYTAPSPVISFQLSNSKIVLVEMQKLQLFALGGNLEHIKTIETRRNPLGLCELCKDSSWELLVYPGKQIGTVQFVNLRNVAPHTTLTPITLVAHYSDLQRMTLNNSGSLLATGSSKGTVIRLFDTKSAQLLREFRRGTDPATLQCLRFSPCSSFLAVASDKDTVHVFVVKGDSTWFNKKTMWNNVKILNEEAHRACAQFSLPKTDNMVTHTELAFLIGEDDANTSNDPLSSKLSGNGGTLQTNASIIIALRDNGMYNMFKFSSDGTCDSIRDEYYLDWGDDENFFASL